MTTTRVYEIKETCVESMKKCLDHTFSDMTIETIDGYVMFFFHGCNSRDGMLSRAVTYESHINRLDPDELLCCYSSLLPSYMQSRVARATLAHERVNFSYQKKGDRHFIKITNHTPDQPVRDLVAEAEAARQEFLSSFYFYDEVEQCGITKSGRLIFGYPLNGTSSLTKYKTWRKRIKYFLQQRSTYCGNAPWVYVSIFDNPRKEQYFKKYHPGVELVYDPDIARSRGEEVE
jgi:hypothetical protein